MAALELGSINSLFLSLRTKASLKTKETKNQIDQKLFVSGLPQDASVRNIKHYFAKFGSIEKVEMLHINPFDKTHCFVVYRDKKVL